MSQKPSPFINVPCPLCGSTKFEVKYKGTFPEELSEEFLANIYRSSSDNALFEQVVRCNDCGTVYLNPRLKPEQIIHSYAEGEDEAHVAQDEERRKTFEKGLKHLANEFSIPLNANTKVLDIGCAGGPFLEAAQNLGCEAVGIEPNKWMCEYAQKRGLDARPGVLADHHFDDNTFDLITLWDVIEHVPDPNAELTEIHRILKPGGTLVINYPDYRSLPAALLGRRWPFWLSVHLTYYTPRTITRHLNEHQFDVKSITAHWQTLKLGYVLHRMTPYVKIAKGIKSQVEKIGLGQFPITYWMGQMRVVAQKKKEQ